MPQAQKRRQYDPYALAQARQRKAANLARQATLKKARELAMGNPVRGRNTPFLVSLTTVVPQTLYLKKMATAAAAEAEKATRSMDGSLERGEMATTEPTTLTDRSAELPKDDGSEPSKPLRSRTLSKVRLNYGLRPGEIEAAIEHSRSLLEPDSDLDGNEIEPMEFRAKQVENQVSHAKAVAAMTRVLDLARGSRIDLQRVQRQRCIETFGRHSTDNQLPAKPQAVGAGGLSPLQAPTKTPRAGPDTGSPEVQIALLTLRINSLASHLSKEGRPDKVNKRNLILLVHRRQKMLNYLRRQDRGASRWQHVVEKLGISERMWKGEISLA